MTPQEQARVFCAMLCCGACMGAVYDLLMPLRRTKWLCAAGDLLFGVLCAAGVIAACLAMQTEAFRLYVFAGTGLGLTLYGLTIGAVVRWIIRRFVRLRQKAEKKCEKRKSAAGI